MPPRLHITAMRMYYHYCYYYYYNYYYYYYYYYYCRLYIWGSPFICTHEYYNSLFF